MPPVYRGTPQLDQYKKSHIWGLKPLKTLLYVNLTTRPKMNPQFIFKVKVFPFY
jgi:hypothetical protein